jgi:hypothetical protein
MIPPPAGSLLFDTGIYISFSRGVNYLWLGENARVFQRTILTAVVAAELYAGSHDHREKRVLDALCRAHVALGHFSSPSAAAWIGLMPAFFCGAPGEPSGKWISWATFAIF